MSVLVEPTRAAQDGDDVGAGEREGPPKLRSRLRWNASGRSAWPLSNGLLALGFGVLSAVPRLATTAASFIIADEPRWMYRSQAFSDALMGGNPSDASATSLTDTSEQATMPGVLTMWIGSAARGLSVGGRRLGVVPANEGSSSEFAQSAAGLKIAQTLVVLASAALVALLVLLVARWAGRTAAGVAGALLATEPFLVAHSAVLHTDVLYSFLGIGSLIATALLVGVPHRTVWFGQRHLALLAGGLYGASWLTKVSALMFLPSAALLFGWGYLRARRHGHRASGSTGGQPDGATTSGTSLRRAVTWWVGAALVVMIVAYPALWADPTSEVANLWKSARLVADNHDNFFLGEATSTPGPLFYLVALPFRMTPWTLLALVGAVVALVGRPGARGYGGAVVVMAGPSLVILSAASKQFDRYGLPLLVVAAVVVGIGAQQLYLARERRSPCERAADRTRRRSALAAAVAVLAFSAHSLVIAPWGLAYFNPLLGGSAAAEDSLLVGVGEGLDEAFALVEDHAPNGCDDIEVRLQGWLLTPTFWACDNVTRSGHESDYVILYVTHNQRAEPERLERLTDGRDLVGTVEIRGITYAEVYGPGEPPA